MRYVLYVCSATLELWLWRRQTTERLLALGNDEAGQAALGDILSRLPRRSTTLLLDQVEEQHVCESMARLNRLQRQAWLQRRLAKRFSGQGWRCWRTLGTSSAAKETVIMSAAGNDAAIADYLKLLLTLDLPVSAVCGAGLVSADPVPADGRSACTYLLVADHGATGTRISVIRRRRVILSRLLPPQRSTALVSELGRTCKYLRDMHLVASTDALPVYLTHGDDEALVSGCRRLGLQIRRLDTDEYQWRQGLVAAAGAGRAVYRPAAGNSTWVQLQWRRWRYRLRQLATIAVTLCLTTALLDLGLEYRQWRWLASELAELNLQRRTLEAKIPPTPAAPAQMRALVQRFQELDSAAADSRALLGALEQALSGLQPLQLLELTWADGELLQASGAAELRRWQFREQALPVLQPGDRVVLLRGRLLREMAAYRQLSAQLTQLVSAMDRHPRLRHTQLLATPASNDPTHDLGGAYERSRTIADGDFVLRSIYGR